MKITLDKPTYGGECLGHVEGKATFVPLTLPGETVQAHFTEEKRTSSRAELDEVLVPSPHRVPPACPYFGSCGGCQYQHAAYPAQLEMKRQILRETLTRAGVPVPAAIETVSGEPWGYRNRIRLAVTPAGQLAYRSRRSHERIAVTECPIAAPILVQTALAVGAWIATSPPPVPVTELELFTNHDQSEVLLTLFTESAAEAEVQPWLETLHTGMQPRTTGIRLQIADGAISPRVLAQAGEAALTYSVAGLPYRVDHGAFFQVSRHLLDAFVSLVTSNLSGDSAWDLYAGVGLFARRLTGSFAKVTAVESAPGSLSALQHNLAGTSALAIGNTTLGYLRHNRQEREPRPDLIVLDPPRAGLGDETTTLLNAIQAPAMVYVSCDPTTLARDLRALTQERYRIESVTLVDMFPQTFHMETVVCLRRG